LSLTGHKSEAETEAERLARKGGRRRRSGVETEAQDDGEDAA